ncbi:MAG: response regulator [Microgenomates group bacterium]|jgi:DNA-binding response OmpR family regulator
MAHILIIEDEKAMSDLVTIRFKVEGFETEQAFTLAEAKQKLIAGSKYDVILTDYLLPDGSLTDFLTSLRADPTLKDLPVVIMTNYVEDLNNDQLKSLGVLDILIKYQVVPAQMVARIKQILKIP